MPTLFTDPHSGMGPSGICVYLLSKNTACSRDGKLDQGEAAADNGGCPEGGGVSTIG